MKNWYLSLWLLLIIFGCEGTKEEVESNATYIADQPVKIAYNGTKLYVHPVDNADYIAWGNSSVLTGANSQTSGEENTRKITETFGEGKYAAYICDTLTAYGHNDWYLPSVEELDTIYSNSDKIIILESENYWSSTEISKSRAWRKDFNDGAKDTIWKSQSENVRCVRRE